MAEQLNVLLKIVALSALSSAIIKYGVPFSLKIKAVTPSNVGALVAILLPSIVLAGLLWWRSQQDSSPVN